MRIWAPLLLLLFCCCGAEKDPAVCRSDGALGACCEQGSDCGAGLLCMPAADRSVCSASCDPVDGSAGCPTESVCAVQNDAALCLPHAGKVGDGCSFTDDCRPGLFCENRFPGGYCTAACDKGVPCPDGVGPARCVRLSNDFGTYCLSPCVDDADCRSGVLCTPVGDSGVNVCFPTFED